MATKRFTIIDGYNLMHQAGLAGRLDGPGNLQRARQALIGALTLRMPVNELTLTTLVFDARQPPLKSNEEAAPGLPLQVLFAVDYQDADSMIEHLLATHSAPKQVLVVSSDRRVQTAARRRGAQSIDAGEWWDALPRSNRPGLTSSTSPALPDDRTSGTMTPAERQKWLEEFGGK